MAYTPKGMSVVFVGCGGTYWTSGNYFCSLLKRLQPLAIHYVDPDRLTEKNTERQWCEGIIGDANVEKVMEALHGYTPIELLGQCSAHCMTFQRWAAGATNGGHIDPLADVMVVVNVDNDAARLAIRRWCLNRPGRTIMVMSGCDMNYGQVYFGVYERLSAVHDWLPFHLEVGDPNHKPADGQGPQGCGAQSTLSNYMTGALFAPAILEVVKFWDPNADLPETVGEYYWKRDTKEDVTRMWTTRVARLGTKVEEVI